MARIILKAVLWGAVFWLVLGLALFFITGFYEGFITQDPNAEVSSFWTAVLRYSAIVLALGIAVYVFIESEKKLKVAELKAKIAVHREKGFFNPATPGPIPPKPAESGVFIQPKPFVPPKPPTQPPSPVFSPKPAPKEFIPPTPPPIPLPPKPVVPVTKPAPIPPAPPKPAESGVFIQPKPFVLPKPSAPVIQPTRPFGPPPVQTFTPLSLPKSEDLKKTPDQTPWS
ncbi:MAG: hypothetical protein A2931_03225 [Candidatus Niyogibacteria bacterium RIFCSPLOWO2_01_FULL_45_48]|uniref:Uncharacterized protein n=1 Tax=Candidatus Niyogibacteria bacterium RIFCSPLOWO2_01_FULL_45_48 TaxID=1801724 RepID=A0A1G2F025_9BACT|nr:MAG: hypothetical protein A2931_03225 [Candidatus Niyogibacteria bacterium RIFCSPLOWO2_01_FULL_45_48]